MDREEVLAIVPARGGSKGIPHKNRIELCGEPLINYTFNAINSSKYLSRTIVSTDDEVIKKLSIDRGYEVMDRPVELGLDMTTTAEVIADILSKLHTSENYHPKYVMILQPTSPLRTGVDIDECIKMIITQEVDSVISVEEVPHNCLPQKIMELKDGYLQFYQNDGVQYTTRQKLGKKYARNGAAIYLFKTETFINTNSYYGDKCLPYIMKHNDSIDIDTLEDLELVEAYLMCKRSKK